MPFLEVEILCACDILKNVTGMWFRNDMEWHGMTWNDMEWRGTASQWDCQWRRWCLWGQRHLLHLFLRRVRQDRHDRDRHDIVFWYRLFLIFLCLVVLLLGLQCLRCIILRFTSCIGSLVFAPFKSISLIKSVAFLLSLFLLSLHLFHFFQMLRLMPLDLHLRRSCRSHTSHTLSHPLPAGGTSRHSAGSMRRNSLICVSQKSNEIDLKWFIQCVCIYIYIDLLFWYNFDLKL